MPVSPLFTQPHHPVVLTPEGAESGLDVLLSLARERRDDLVSLMATHGAVLVRGFQLQGAADFQAAVAALGGTPHGYVGGNSPRSRVDQDVWTATDYPATEVISPHNELSYLREWPRRLFFYSDQPALTGGQTSLVHGGDVLDAMPDEVQRPLRERGVRYVRRFHPKLRMGKTWQQTYGTDDRDVLSSILREQGSEAHWGPEGELAVSTVCPAFARHDATGREVWFNQAEQWHPSALAPALRRMLEPRGQLAHHCEFGDGTPMDDAMLQAVRRVVDAGKLLFDWHRGDLLMLDNVLLMHGRESFTGTRRTWAYLSAT